MASFFNELKFFVQADMIFWALALGVSFISIYDRKGVILRNESVMRKTIEAKTVQFMGVAKRTCCQIDFHTLADPDLPGKGRKNGKRSKDAQTSHQ